MEKLGFSEKWRSLIMQYVSTITYSIKINGVPRGNIVPSRRVSVKETLYHLTFFSYVQRDSHH